MYDLDDVEKEDESVDALPDFMKPDEDDTDKDTDKSDVKPDTEDNDKAGEE
jgi:hypothetical protein